MPSLSSHAALYTFAALTAVVELGCSAAQRVYPDDSDAGVGGGTATGGTHTAPGKTTTVGGSSAGANSGGTSSVGGVGSGGANTTGGAATGGVATSAGGLPSTGGASTNGGGATATGGAPTNVGGASATGGANAIGGTSTTVGGTSTTGDATATGGVSATGGTPGCTKDADCVNSDPTNCSYTCVNPGASGTCKPTVTLTPTQCATSACDDRAISGYWDAAGKPHIAYAFTETDGSASIHMQQVKADGTADGAATAYKLATGQLAPKLLSANAIGSKVGLLYQTRVLGQQSDFTDYDKFAITDVTGAASTPAELAASGNSGGIGWVRLYVTPAGAWFGLARYGNPAVEYWSATSGSNLGPWTALDPALYDSAFAATVVGNTLMVTGASCNPRYPCTPTFNLQRYSAASLSSIGSMITLSQDFHTIASAAPAMGTVAGQAALLWTETQSPGQIQRAVLKEDGTFAHPIDTVQSAISPRAIVQAGAMGSTLIGVITFGASIQYQLVGQRLDSNLGLVGNPLPIAAAQSADVTNIEVHPSADGTQVLVTYRQAGARYRLLGTNLCGS